MLNAGRVDAVLAIEDDARGAAKTVTGSLEAFRRTDSPLNAQVLSLIVAQDHPQAEAIIAAFNKGLAQLHDSGEYDRIKEEFDDVD